MYVSDKTRETISKALRYLTILKIMIHAYLVSLIYFINYEIHDYHAIKNLFKSRSLASHKTHFFFKLVSSFF
jgi:hypothetical protein